MSYRYFEGQGRVLRTGWPVEWRRFEVFHGGDWVNYPHPEVPRIEEVEEVAQVRALHVIETVMLRAFDEAEHPREKDGKFTAGAGGGGGGALAGAWNKVKDVFKDPVEKGLSNEPTFVPSDRASQTAFANKAAVDTAPQWFSLTPNERNSVGAYATDREHSYASDGAAISMVKFGKPATKELDVLTAALDKGSLPHAAMLFNTTQLSRLGVDAGSIEGQVGNVLTDHGFSVATTNVSEMKGGGDSGKAVLRIKAPAGSTGMWIGGNDYDRGEMGVGHPRVSVNRPTDFVVQRGARYMVTGVTKGAKMDDGKHQMIVDVTLLPHHAK